MIKTLLGQVGEYKKDSILTPVFTAAEVFMEILIPFVTAKIIDEGINGQDMSKVYMYGGLMLVLAFLSLFFGVMAGKFAASASTGFACNLREGMYRNVQEFSFTNIDKFSTASLITRMTTDVTNVQNAYQMLIRIAATHAHLQYDNVLYNQRGAVTCICGSTCGSCIWIVLHHIQGNTYI